MLIGRYEHTLDAKSRVNFPPKLRAELGETFYITVGELKFDFAWYYKDTDTKFNFNQPITEDVEIEMRMFDGAVDDDTLENVDDFVDDVEDFFDFLKDL